MNSKVLSVWLQGQACVTRVEAMRAENTHAVLCGRVIPYGDNAFNMEADRLEQLVLTLQQDQVNQEPSMIHRESNINLNITE